MRERQQQIALQATKIDALAELVETSIRGYVEDFRQQILDNTRPRRAKGKKSWSWKTTPNGFDHPGATPLPADAPTVRIRARPAGRSSRSWPTGPAR